MDPQNQPFSAPKQPEGLPHGAPDDMDEAKAAAILGIGQAPASSTSFGGPAAGAPAAGSPAPAPVAGPAAPVPGFAPAPASAPVPMSGSTSTNTIPPMPSFTPSPGFGPGAGAAGASQPAASASSVNAPDISSYDDIPPATPAGMVSPKKNRKWALMGGIAGVLVAILLGSSAAAYYVIMNKPQNVLNMALANGMSGDKVQSASFSGSVEIAPKDQASMSLSFSGASNNEGAFTFSGKADAMVANIKFDMLSADGKTLYLRVGGLDGLSQLLSSPEASSSGYGPLISGIISMVNNQWIEINQSMLQQLTGTKTDFSSKLSDADRKKLEDAYKQHQFLQVNKALKEETISGEKSHHYQVIIDKTNLKDFMTALRAANISALKLDNTSVQEFNKQISGFNFAKYPVDIWISKDAKLVNQVGFTTTQQGTRLNAVVTIKDVNKPVQVTAPAGSKTILEIMSNLLQTYPQIDLNPQGGGLGGLGTGISL